MTEQYSDVRAAAALAALNLPADKFKNLPAHLLEHSIELADMHDTFFAESMTKGAIDRARLRDCLAAYGRLRIELLSYIGADLQSGEILPLPVILLDH